MSKFNAMAVQLVDEQISNDTSGSDGSGGDDSVKEHFIERFTAMCEASGAAIPQSLVSALATEVAAFVAEYESFMDEDGASSRADTRQLTALQSVTRFRLIAGGKSE